MSSLHASVPDDLNLSVLFPDSHEHVVQALHTADPDPESWIAGSDDEGNPWAVSGMGQITALIHRPADWVVHVEHHGCEGDPSIGRHTDASALPELVRQLME